MLTLFVEICDVFFFFFKQKTAYEITYGDWSSDVCSSDLGRQHVAKAVLRRTTRRARRTITARATPGFSPQNWSFRLRLLPVNCRQPMMFHFPAGASANWEPKSANLDSWRPSATAPCGVGFTPTPSVRGNIAAGSFHVTQSSLSKQG